MSNIKKKVTLASIILIVVVLMLSGEYYGGIVSEVRADEQNAPPCSVRTLRGRYGNSFQFLNTNPLPFPVPIGVSTHTPGVGIGFVTFDGQGNYVGQTTASIGGLILHNTVSGTYTVNPNCTGSRVANFNGLTSNFEFVVVDHGKELHEVSTDPGAVALGTWKK